MVLVEFISANESYLWLLDIKTGKKELLTPKGGNEKIAFADASFAHDGKSLFVVTDKDSEFQRLGRFDLTTKKFTPLTAHIKWDIEEMALLLPPMATPSPCSPTKTGSASCICSTPAPARKFPRPKFPPAFLPIPVKWHENSRDLGFNLNCCPFRHGCLFGGRSGPAKSSAGLKKRNRRSRSVPFCRA